MELIFNEKCHFNGFEFEVPTWAKNKSTAKRYFKLEGWHYSKELVFCKDCFGQLKKGILSLTDSICFIMKK